MRIAWFTPFADGTGIAEYSAVACERLIDLGDEPVVVRTDEPDRPQRAFAGEVATWRSRPDVQDCAVAFYNFGDDHREYGRMFDLLRRRPGIAFFHDATLVRYFADHAAASGRAAIPLDAAASLGHVAIEATGAVLFGKESSATIRASCAGPVLHLPDRHAETAAEPLAAFARQVTAVEPIVGLVWQLGDRMGEIGVPRGDPAVARLARVTGSLLPGAAAALD